MKFMLIVKAGSASEAGEMPSSELIGEIMRFNEEMVQAGVLLGLNGLHPTSKGARVEFQNGAVTVTDGPFAETKELLGGYWIIEVPSREVAIEWAKRSPAPLGPDAYGQIEVRQIFDPSDFGDAVDPDAHGRISAAIQEA